MNILKLKQGTGLSKEEVANELEFNLPIKFDATRAYNSYVQETKNPDIKEFAKEYLKKKVKDIPGAGVVIVLDSAVKNSRIRPYSVTNYPTSGKRSYKMAYQLVDQDGKIHGIVYDKSQAESVSKEIITRENGAVISITAQIIKTVVAGTSEGFKISFTPSTGSKEGSYVFFGYETISE